MTPRAELAEAVCRKMWADIDEGGMACPGCRRLFDLPAHAPTCPLVAWHAAAEAPRGWTVRRRCWSARCDGYQRLTAFGSATSCNRRVAVIYPTLAAAREARARYTTGDGWRVCRVVKKKDGG